MRPKFVRDFPLHPVDTDALLMYGCMLRWLACVDSSSHCMGSIVMVPNVYRDDEYS
jgi:hypothetical protein